MKAITAGGFKCGERGADFMKSNRGVFLLVLSLYSLMTPILPSLATPPAPSSSPPTSSSSLLILLQQRGAPVVCVTVDPCKEDRSNISPPVYEAFHWGLADMMIGADGRTGAPGFEVCNRQRWL